MIKAMTIDDYEELFIMWKKTPNMGLRSLDNSKEGISFFLNRNPNTNFVEYEDDKIVGSVKTPHIFILFVRRSEIRRQTNMR